MDVLPSSGCRPDPFRDFIDLLRRRQQLLTYNEEVDCDFEICAFCRHSADEDGPALLFQRPGQFGIPVLVNMFGTRERIALALGVRQADMVSVINERLCSRLPPVLIGEAAPCQENILVGDAVNLDALPIPLWNDGDGGRYLTAGIAIGEHPAWGKNAGIYRNMVRNRHEIFAQIAPDHQQRLFYEDIGPGCPMAIAIGADPLLYLAAGSDFRLGEYELDVAGALRGQPLRVVQAKTIALEVPADAEFILETEFTGTFDEEGPFNEFTGYQSERRLAPIWRVKAITHRDQPIMHHAFAGKPPNENVAFWRELEDAVAFDALHRRFPLVTAVARPADLARDFWGVVQVDAKLQRPGVIRNVLLALTFFMPRLKYIVAVDHDIDLQNVRDVLWAISTRVDPARDTFIVPETGTGPIDPSSYQFAITSKLYIDATKKPHFRGVVSSPPSHTLLRARRRFDAAMKRWRDA